MRDVPLARAHIVWDTEPPKGEPPVVVEDSARGRSDDRYISSWGSGSEFADAQTEAQLAMLFRHFAHLVIAEKLDASAVNKAFMVIPEWRSALAEGGTIDPRLAAPDDY